jgi:peptidoglycan hydrolase-like protein with peptidoglycan-binding domain
MSEPTAEALVKLAETQAGGRYLYGGKASPSDPDPKEHGHPLDCSGLVSWAAERLGDRQISGSAQMIHDYCEAHGTMISVAKAEVTVGAVMFLLEGGSIGHIVISRGNRTTIEAKGRAWGIGEWPDSESPWHDAALLPGINYTGSKPAPAPSKHRLLELTSPPMHGADVKDVQVELDKHERHIATDGIYGPATQAAVEAFQRREHLTVDGVVGPKTRSALGL